MAMLGVIPWSIALAAIAASGGLFGAWYALRAVQKVLMGSSKPARNREPVAEREASFAEFSSLIGIGMCCLVLGIFPMSLLSLFGRDARSIIQSYDRPAVQAAELGPAHREGETHG
jgi:NADH:ubiquinone oxidoreductase subunit 4 (subunit M)